MCAIWSNRISIPTGLLGVVTQAGTFCLAHTKIQDSQKDGRCSAQNILFFALRVQSQWAPLCINLKNLKSTLLDANHGPPLKADLCKDYILMPSSPQEPYPSYIIPFPICIPRSSLFAHSYHHLNNLTSSRINILPTHIFLQPPH